MFFEIRRTEKITEKTEKERKLDWLYFQLADCLAGSKKSEEILREIDQLEQEDEFHKEVFDPDQLITRII